MIVNCDRLEGGIEKVAPKENLLEMFFGDDVSLDFDYDFGGDFLEEMANFSENELGF